MALAMYQERVVQEREDLNNKIVKLKTFMEDSTLFSKVPTEERQRMGRQLVAMTQYRVVLDERIAAWQ